MDIKHLIAIRRKYRCVEQINPIELKRANDDLRIGLIIAVGKLGYCKGRMTLMKKKINQLESEIEKLKNNKYEI